MKKNVLSINNWTGKREVIILRTKVKYIQVLHSQMALRWMIRNNLLCVVKNRQTTIVNIDKIG